MLLPIPVTLVVLVAFAVITSGLVHRYLHGRAALSGVEYVFIGMLVGRLGVGLLSTQVVDHLRPFLFLALGLAGFTLGLRVRARLAQASGFLAGMLSAALVAVAVGAAAFAMLSTSWAPANLYDHRLWMALTLGAAATATSSMAVEMAIARANALGPATETLRGFALAGSVTAVVIAGATLAQRRAWSESNQMGMTPAEWLVAVLSLGLVIGLLFRVFIGARADEDQGEDEDRLFLALVGTITFTSGIAAAVGVSPLLTCAVAGATVSLVSRAADTLEHSMERLERPALAVLTIFAGAMWLPLDGLVWLLPAGYLLARSAALFVSTRVGLASHPELPPSVGMGGAMSTQGGLAAAIVLDYALVYREEGVVVLTVVLTPLWLFDLIGTGRLARYLTDAGESGRHRFHTAEPEAEPVAEPDAESDAEPDAESVAESVAESDAESDSEPESTSPTNPTTTSEEPS